MRTFEIMLLSINAVFDNNGLIQNKLTMSLKSRNMTLLGHARHNRALSGITFKNSAFLYGFSLVQRDS